MPERFFNTTGPCDPARHYMLPAEARLPGLQRLIDREQYFVLHAARQTGKTTAMRAFAARLRSRGVVALHTTLETSQGFTEVAKAEDLWMSAIAQSAGHWLPEAERPPERQRWSAEVPGSRLRAWLSAWCALLPDRGVVLLLDEADVVTGDAMVNLLRQLRGGFMDRGPGRFPTSVALIGMRDLRDYLTAAKDGVQPSSGSPFNIKQASLTLRNFELAEVEQLYAQHRAETGQEFTPGAVSLAWSLSQGQPFLVNKLAAICMDELAENRELPITEAHVLLAKERLILERTTHLDSLAERLREPRVAALVRAVVLGDEPLSIAYEHDDWQYVVDLGLLRRGPEGAEPANPIYREVLVRQLSLRTQLGLPAPGWRWALPDGSLNFPALVSEFLSWWRENAAVLERHADRNYLEAVPHLCFMAFLQRVVNGGGVVHREYAAGRGAIDIFVEFGPCRHLVELKRVAPQYSDPIRVRERGIEQVCRYLDMVGLKEGWLMIFDQRPGRSWEERLSSEDVEQVGRVVHIRGA